MDGCGLVDGYGGLVDGCGLMVGCVLVVTGWVWVGGYGLLVDGCGQLVGCLSGVDRCHGYGLVGQVVWWVDGGGFVVCGMVI